MIENQSPLCGWIDQRERLRNEWLKMGQPKGDFYKWLFEWLENKMRREGRTA